MKKIAVISGICATLLVAPNASPAPCTGVDQKISDVRKAELAAPIAAQLNMGEVAILGSMRLKDWSIVYVNPHNADEGFLFFKGSPSTTHYITLRAGAARKDEGKAIDQWVLENAPGIPERLAACFGWSVTGGDRPSR